MLKNVVWSLVGASLIVGVLGCSSQKTDVKTSSQKAAPQEPVGEVSKNEGATKTPTKTPDKTASHGVDVTKEGSKFDPPIAKDKVPDGAYYCDMGTVHYARMEEGDGKCPLCGMALKHKATADAKGHENHEHHDHSGHDHH